MSGGLAESYVLGIHHHPVPEALLAFVYTGYLDESGTHGDSPVTVVGGILARAEQWKKFQAKYDAAKKKHGFRIFHTKKLKSRSGDFAGWTDDQVEALVWDLRDITGRGLTEGVSMTVNNEDFKNLYRGENRKGVRFDSAYGLCFRTCLYHFIFEVMKRNFRGKVPDLHIVIEGGHKNAGDAVRIFNEVKAELAKHGFTALKTLALADKDESDELMVADFLAHSSYQISIGKMPSPPEEHEVLAAGIPLPKDVTAIMHYETTPQALANMHDAIVSKLRGKL